MCSKASWYKHGEKSSKYFLNLEKRSKAKSHICTLISDSGNQVNNLTEIMSKVRYFHSKLYTRQSTKTEKECLGYLVGSIYQGLTKLIIILAKVSLQKTNAGKHFTL